MFKYEDACEYLDGLSKKGIRPGLEAISLLLEALGNPQNNLNFIHVAGTNGKGSTSLFIASILRAAGFKVGVYASPAVFSDREIIKVNGREISKAEYADLLSAISEKNIFDATRFEVETALAFLYFEKKDCDYVVLEAGMGGLLDATNVIEKSLVSVFTSIGLDHVSFLGDTIEKITENKAGIIKNNSIAVSTCVTDSQKAIFESICESKNSQLIISDYTRASNIKYKADKTRFNYKGYKDLEISLLGTFQIQNACLAIDAVCSLALENANLEKIIKKGLISATEKGRFEKISDKPVVFIDGAHNEAASLRIKECIETYFTKKKIFYIMGMFRDKDVETVVKNTASLADCIFTIPSKNKQRTLSSFELADIVRKYNPVVTSMDSAYEAVEVAMQLADKDTVILGFGSLSILGDIESAVKVKKSGVKR